MIGSKLSIKDSKFHIVSDTLPLGRATLETTSLDVIIIGANPNLAKQYYEGEWSNDRESNSPDCFSLDGKTPSENSVSPQNDVCVLCPHNAWGSGVTPQGHKVKACSDIKRLAIIFSDKPDGEVYLLQITPSSLKNLNAYQKTLSMRGIVPEIAKTTLSFDNEAGFPKLKFQFGGFVNKDTQVYVDSLLDSEKVKIVTGQLGIPSEKLTTAEDFGFSVEVGYSINNESEDL